MAGNCSRRRVLQQFMHKFMRKFMQKVHTPHSQVLSVGADAWGRLVKGTAQFFALILKRHHVVMCSVMNHVLC